MIWVELSQMDKEHWADVHDVLPDPSLKWGRSGWVENLEVVQEGPVLQVHYPVPVHYPGSSLIYYCTFKGSQTRLSSNCGSKAKSDSG